MLYVGLDIHSKKIVSRILDGNGKVRQRATVRQVDQMLDVLQKLPDRFMVWAVTLRGKRTILWMPVGVGPT